MSRRPWTPSATRTRARICTLIGVLSDGMAQTLPLGRKLIKLTVDSPPASQGASRDPGGDPAGPAVPKRGYRRVRWIEQAIEPIRPQLDPDRFERLVSGLAVMIGWEAFIVLYDVRGLTRGQARAVITDAALALIDAALT